MEQRHRIGKAARLPRVVGTRKRSSGVVIRERGRRRRRSSHGEGGGVFIVEKREGGVGWGGPVGGRAAKAAAQVIERVVLSPCSTSPRALEENEPRGELEEGPKDRKSVV